MTQIDQSARETPFSPQSPSWASGSLAVVLPARGAPVGSRRIGPDNLLWTLRSSAKAAPRGGPPIAISETHLAAMRSDVGYTAVYGKELRDNRALVNALPQDGGWLVRAVEVFTYADIEMMSYVVLHVALTAPALDGFAGPTEWFLDPRHSDQALRHWSTSDRHALLRSLGFGPTARRRPEDLRPFVITHLVPDGPSLPPLPTPLPTQVPADARDQTPDGYWLGSSWCAASSTGLALIETRGVPEAGVTPGEGLEPAVVEGFAHHEAVDLVVLAMRQSVFLTRHAETLANAWDVEPDSAPTTLASVLRTSQEMRQQADGFDQRLAGFRRDLWLDFTDADQPVQRTMTSVQAALGLPTRLREIEGEQAAVTEALLDSAQHISRRVAEHYDELPTEESFCTPLRTQAVESVLFVVVALGMTHAAAQVVRGDRGPTPYFWVALLLIAGAFLGLWAVGRITARRAGPHRN